MRNKKISDLEVVTIILIGISIIIYEILFCNYDAIRSGNYNFSLFRIVIYIVIFFLYKKYSRKFIDEAEKVLDKKRKLIIAYLVLVFIYTIISLIKEFSYHNFFLRILGEICGLLFLLYVTKDYIKNIIVTILTFGLMYTISVTVYHEIDEKKHFMSALNVATGNFDMNNSLTDKTFNDIEFKTPMFSFASKYFSEKCQLNMEKFPEDESVFSTPADYNYITYFPSALGINMARLLGGSVADVYLAGRLFNIITYGILLIILFKILPFKKNVFYVMYLLPIGLALAASYSIDGMTTGLIGIFIAYVLKLYKENQGTISVKQFLILVGLFGLTLICKKGAYLGIGLIICLLPILKSTKKDKKMLYVILTILVLGISIGIYQGSKIANNAKGDERVDNSSPKEQIQYLKEHPTHIVKAYRNFERYFMLNLGWYNELNTSLLFKEGGLSITFVLFIFVLYTAITDSSYTFKKKEKIMLVLVFSVVFFITSFPLYLAYTPIGKSIINGYQARYLIPIIPLILSIVNTKKIKEYEDGEYNKIVMINGIINLIDILFLI